MYVSYYYYRESINRPSLFLDLDLTTNALLDLLIDQSYPIMFKCEACGKPLPTINWEFNYENTSDTSKYNKSTKMNGCSVESTLAIVNPQLSDRGVYTCKAENGITRLAYVVLTTISKYLCCMHIF